jgi:hypothetical protein
MERKEVELEIVEKPMSNGTVAKNIHPKPSAKNGINGLPENGYVTVKKIFDEAKSYDSKFKRKDGTPKQFGSAKVEYKGEEVYFLLSEPEMEAFNTTGGANDLIKVFWYKESFENRNTGVETVFKRLGFEKVE